MEFGIGALTAICPPVPALVRIGQKLRALHEYLRAFFFFWPGGKGFGAWR
jgi:hypothetical protein